MRPARGSDPFPAAPRAARRRAGAGGDVLAAVAAGAVVGGLGRHGVAVALPAAHWPWPTFAVNVSGSLLLGVLMGLVLEVWPPRRYVRPFLGVGVIGGWTTFSTYAVEAVQLARAGAPGTAASYVLASVVAALVAVAAGLAAVRLLVVRRPTDRPVGGEGCRVRLEGRACRLTVLVGEGDTWHGRPLYAEIVHRCHAGGLAGAGVFRGIEGFGASSRVHTTRLLSLGGDLPLAIVVVDVEERIRAFLPQLDELVAEGLVVLDEVEVVRYVGRRE